MANTRRKTVPGQCPLNDIERNNRIAEVLERRLGAALDKYFEESPFMVEHEQHYKDHEVVKDLRIGLDTVKTSFWKSLGKLMAAAFLGIISWKAIAQYIIK